MSSTAPSRPRLVRSLNGILGLIGLEFLIGMWLNLFGTFPASNPTLAAAATDTSSPLLIAHVVIGAFLGLGALVILILSFRDPYRTLRWFALGGLIGVAIAGFAGSAYVGSGYVNNDASYVMAVGFAIALASYYEGLVALRGRPVIPEPPVVAASASSVSP
jgi:heme A synthase